MASDSRGLKRRINLLQATAINMIDMVGIGPFVAMPLVIGIVGNHLYIWAWVFGAITSLIDGMIWSELGASFPLAGGSYNFLKEAYGKKWGPMLSFLFVWQTCLQAPLVVASGGIGFSQYFSYLVPLGFVGRKIVSGTVVLLIIFLLYRKIETIGKISVFLWAGVVITILWIIISGFTHQQVSYSFLPEKGESLFHISFALLIGQASVKTIYSFLGYYNVCHLGSEIQQPGKNIPRSIFLSIFGITALYLLMNFSIAGVLPWQTAMKSEFIVSSFMEKIYGHQAGMIATMLILWITFASLFAVMLGYSRVPYAAAADGQFFREFARLHPRKNFPYISLLFIGGLGLIFSMLFRLKDVISAILAMRILIQFVAQAAGVVLLRKRNGTAGMPFKMWLYPLPVVLSILIWLFVFYSTGWMAVLGISLIAAGMVVYYFTRGLWGNKIV